jgi:hypothetical protein
MMHPVRYIQDGSFASDIQTVMIGLALALQKLMSKCFLSKW